MEVNSIHEIYHEELSQDSIDTNIKDFEDIIQENELRNSSPNWIVASLYDVFMWIPKHLNRFFKSDQNLSTKQLKKQIKITKLNDMINHLKNMHSTYEYKLKKKENFYQNTIKSLESKISKMLEDNRKLQDSVKSYSTHATMELEKINAVINEMEIDTKFKKNQKLLQKITKSNDFINHLKNMLSTYESEMVEKENIYQNIIKSLESKNVKLVEKNVNLLDDIKLFLTHTEMELEKKNAVIKEMEIDTKIKENQIKTLKESTKLLYKEKTSLEKHIESLKENENLLDNKLSNALSEIEKKQETVKELETMGVQLRAEIQPLEYMKNSLEKKLGSFKKCNKIQSEKIKYLESNNIELLNECIILKEDKKILEDRIDTLVKKEVSDKNYIETLTNTIQEEHYTQQEVLQKLESLEGEYQHLQNKIHEMQDKQDKHFLDECEKLKSDIHDFKLQEELYRKQSRLITNLEVEKTKLTSKVIKYRYKYNKIKAYTNRRIEE